MKKLLFILLGCFTLAAFTGFNEEELNTLSAGIQEAKEDQEDIEEDLCQAVKDGDYDTFFELYPQSPNRAKTICDINGKQVPLIIVAAKYTDDNEDILFDLIHMSKANVETRDGDGFTPLMWAVVRGNTKNATFLIEKCNANVNAKNNFGNDVLFQANDSKMIALLKKHGAIDEAEEAEKEEKYKKIVEELENVQMWRGCWENYEIPREKFIDKLKSIRALGYQVPTKLFHKFRDWNDITVEYMTKQNITDYLSKYEPFPTLLFEAINGSSRTDFPKDVYVEKLLKRGADANRTNAVKETPLIAFFRYQENPSFSVDTRSSCGINKEEAKKIIQLLIKYGDVNATDRRGCTALGYAKGLSGCPRSGRHSPTIEKGLVRSPQDIIDLLISNGARY